MGDRVARRRIPIGVALSLLFALLAVPDGADAKRRPSPKPTIRLAAKLPPLGHAALAHAVFKVKPPSGRTSASEKGGRLRVQATLRNRSRLPRNALVFLRVGKARKGADAYAADMLLINSRTAGASRSAATSKDTIFQVSAAVRGFYDGDEDAEVRQARTGILDNDLNLDNGSEHLLPEHIRACREFENPMLREAVLGVFAGRQRFSAKEARGLFRIAEAAACDKPIPFDPVEAGALLRHAGWDSPMRIPPPASDAISCSGDLHPAPPPNEATEIELFLSCTQPLTSVGLELPGGRLAVNHLATPQLPTCDNQQIGENSFWLYCSGGTLPANTLATIRIQPFPTQLGPCDILRVYPNPASATPTAAVTDTDAFATCP